MCGIAGIVTPGMPVEPAQIAAMCDIIRYRGPDDFGYMGWQSESGNTQLFKEMHEVDHSTASKPDVVLGHRRLSILDLSEQGRQPFSYADGRLWMVYNGEVYNYLEIRSELEKKGHVFRTQTDTEVILCAYLEWGEDCLKRFNGMWSFAILDRQTKRLFCARDRLGIKPFHYSLQNGRFCFASEIKQLLMLPWISPQPHDGIFFDYLGFRSYGGDKEQTYFQNIFQLKAGHCFSLQINEALDTGSIKPRCWWDIDLSQKVTDPNDRKCAERYRELLTDAVKLRLRADVPVGTCLSGGFDSSSIVCTVNRILREANPDAVQKTFTVTSEDPKLDEREFAQAVIDATQVQPAFTMPSADSLFASLEKLIWHHDEPFGSTSIFAGWSVFELAKREGVTVTLDGQGPDEMIGGYFSNMLAYRMAQDIASGNWWTFVRDYRSRNKLHQVSLSKVAKLILLEVPGFSFLKRHAADMAAAENFLQPDFLESGKEQSTFLQSQREFGQIRAGIFDRHQYLSTKSGSLPGILRNVDRNSMAFSIESRVPFLDHRLVEYSFSLPADMKLRGGESKWILREAMRDILPAKVMNRKNKIGFATSEQLWVKGRGRKLFEQVFNEIPNDAPYRRDTALRTLNDFLDDKGPYSQMIWRVFHSELWRRQYLTNSVERPLEMIPQHKNAIGV